MPKNTSSKLSTAKKFRVAAVVFAIAWIALSIQVFFIGFGYERPIEEGRIQGLFLAMSAACLLLAGVCELVSKESRERKTWKYSSPVAVLIAVVALAYFLVGSVASYYLTFIGMHESYIQTQLYQEDLKKEAKTSQERLLREKCSHLYSVRGIPDQNLPHAVYMDIETLKHFSADAAELYKKWCPEQK